MFCRELRLLKGEELVLALRATAEVAAGLLISCVYIHRGIP